MALALLVQKFDFVLDDPSYELKLKQSLTIKPANFFVHAIPRAGKARLLAVPSTPLVPPKTPAAGVASAAPGVEAKQPMYVLYGSNTGTSESFAQRIANAAASFGACIAVSLRK